MSLDCCEYDLAVFSELHGENQMIRLKNDTVELLYFDGDPGNRSVTDLYGMKIIRDSNKFMLASLAKSMNEGKYKKALVASGRKLLVSSLFCLRAKAVQNGASDMQGAMWAKIAAYRFISGAIALSGARPMPLHEMEQSRLIEVSGHLAEGIQAALECIGIERATRPAISRSIAALEELKRQDYDKDLVMSKIELLQRRQMLSDCYYYVGRTAAEVLARRNDQFHRRYAKLIQLGLDLTSDAQHLEKLQRLIFASANAILK